MDQATDAAINDTAASEAGDPQNVSLAEGDPRMPPYTDEELDIMKGVVVDPRRWLRVGADVLALRLQYGRGVETMEICRQFGVSSTTVNIRAREGCWSRDMSEANRRDLSRRVWVAGQGQINTAIAPPLDAIARLTAASEWEMRKPLPPMWVPLDGSAHQAPNAPTMTQHEQERQALLANPENPDRTHRDRVVADLDRLMVRLDREQRERAEKKASAAKEGS